MDALDIYSSIIFLPPSFRKTLASASTQESAEPSSPQTALSTALILDQILLSTSSLPPIHPALVGPRVAEKKERSRLFLAAFASPYKGLTVKPGKTVLSAAETIVKEGLKVSRGDRLQSRARVWAHLTRSFLWANQLSGADATYVSKLFQAADSLSNPDLSKFPPPTRRSAIGMFPPRLPSHNPSSHMSLTRFSFLTKETSSANYTSTSP